MKIDLILIGNQGAGKTSLINRYLKSNDGTLENGEAFTHTYTPTLGINLDKKDIVIRDKKINLCVWDTAGHEKFFSLTKSYFQRADGIIVVFDITDEESFKKIEEYWFNQIKDRTDSDVSIILVGNKVDLFRDRNVKFVDAHDLAQHYKIPYFETSAKTGECIDEAFTKIVTMCMDSLEKQMNDTINQNISISPIPPQKNKTNCFSGFSKVFEGVSKIFKKLPKDEDEQKKKSAKN